MQKSSAKPIGLAFVWVWVVVLFWNCNSSNANQPTVIFAASSLTEYTSVLAKAYRKETGESIQLSLAASSTLALQIEAGAPADLFVSANQDWSHFLENKLERKPLVRPYLGNQMVLVGKKGMALPEHIRDWKPNKGRIAIGNPEHVPAGQYAKIGLNALGLWEQVAPRMVPTANVREALRLVMIGEADWALVYSSDARAGGLSSVQVPLPEDQRVSYVAMCLSCEQNPRARRFFEFLFSSLAQTTADTMGFQWTDSP